MSDLAALLREFFEQEKQALHVATPAIVVAFDAAKQSCSVRPMSSIRLAGSEIALPVLEDVPVCFPRAGGFTLSLPLTAGDVVMLFFTDRMLDDWRGAGQTSSPTDPRAHALADAFAFPLGVWPDAQLSSVPSASGAAAVVAGPGGGLRVDPDGVCHLGVPASGFGSQAIALDPAVRLQLAALTPLLTALTTAVTSMAPVVAPLAGAPPAQAAIAAAAAACTAALSTLSAWPASVAAQKAKAL